jgi:phosphoglycolate phosphatase-like HAD superfamily hydrolase
MQDFLIIFDVEGTLVDCAGLSLRCWQEVLRTAGVDIAFDVLQYHSGEGPGEMLPAILPPTALKRAEEIKKAQGACFRERYLPQVKPFPQVRALMERIKGSGRRIGLATTCAPDELKQYLGLLNISDLLDGIACGDDVEREKPSPDLVQLALERCGDVPADRAVMVGDTPYDAMAARRAGVGAIGVLTGGFSKLELKAAGCAEVFADPADMLARAAFTQPLLRAS